MKKDFIITNLEGQKLHISGITLLRIMHEAVSEQLHKYLKNTQMTLLKRGFREINSMFWLISAGHLSIYLAKHDISYYRKDIWFPGKFKIGTEEKAPLIEINDKGVVVFQYCGYDYERITDYLHALMKEKKLLTDSKLAEVLLARSKGIPYPTELSLTEVQKYTLDALLLLMFGVEASRNNDTFLTTLLLLDLIQAEQVYGSKQKLFDWSAAFISRHKYRWDDYENKNYGGKFPMSQSSTGKGNLGKEIINKEGESIYGRGELVSGITLLSEVDPRTGEDNEWEGPYKEEFVMEQFEDYPQRHAVPRREISLLIHWLEAYADQANFSSCPDVSELKKAIKIIFVERLLAGFTNSIPNKVWLNKIDTKDELKEIKELSDKKSDQDKLDSFSSRYCFRLKHSMTGKSAIDGKYHRDTIACKLISDFSIFGESKTLYDDSIISSDIEIEEEFVTEAEYEKNPNQFCNYCFQHKPDVKPHLKNNHLVAIQPSVHSILPKQEGNSKNFTIYQRDMKLYKNTCYIMFYGQYQRKLASTLSDCEGDYVHVPPTASLLTEALNRKGEFRLAKKQKL